MSRQFTHALFNALLLELRPRALNVIVLDAVIIKILGDFTGQSKQIECLPGTSAISSSEGGTEIQHPLFDGLLRNGDFSTRFEDILQLGGIIGREL